MPQACTLTNDEVPGRGEYEWAGECNSIQGEAGWSGPQTAVVEQPNEATAQAEVHRPAVRDDTIMALQRQECDHNERLVTEAGPAQLCILSNLIP